MRRIGRQRGQGLIEFIVIFPFLVFFLFTIFDIGVGLNRQATLQHSAREGARFAAVYDNSGGENVIKDRAIATSQGLLTRPDITVCYVDTDSDGYASGLGDLVNVDVYHTYSPSYFNSALGLFGATDVADFDIHVHASARLELKVDPEGGGC
jgi:Flp pilus assembly protein TadG